MLLAVFGNKADANGNRIFGRPGLQQLSLDGNRAALKRIRAEDDPGNFRAARPDQAPEPDDLATAHFRGFFGQDSVAYYPELEDCYYNSGFLDLVRGYWGAKYAKPTMMLFNLCGPHRSGSTASVSASAS